MTCERYAEWLINEDPDNPEVQTMKMLRETGLSCPNPKCGQIFQ